MYICVYIFTAFKIKGEREIGVQPFRIKMKCSKYEFLIHVIFFFRANQASPLKCACVIVNPVWLYLFIMTYTWYSASMGQRTDINQLRSFIFLFYTHYTALAMQSCGKSCVRLVLFKFNIRNDVYFYFSDIYSLEEWKLPLSQLSLADLTAVMILWIVF